MQINNNNVIIITDNNEYNHIKLYKFGILSLEWVDKKYDNGLGFIRYVGNTKYVIENDLIIEQANFKVNPFIVKYSEKH